MKISDTLSSLVASYCDWSSILINPRYVRQGNTITWENYRPKSFDGPLFPNNVISLIDEGQYSFQIIADGSIIQIYYSYDSKDNLIGANLAYLSMNDNSDLPVGWVRIDYDPLSARGLSHPKCHIHWSLFPNSRIAVNGIPSPRQFIEFILCSFYPEIYEERHFNETGNYVDESRIRTLNSLCFPMSEEIYYKHMSHFVIPSFQTTQEVVTPETSGRIARKSHHKRK